MADSCGVLAGGRATGWLTAVACWVASVAEVGAGGDGEEKEDQEEDGKEDEDGRGG